MANIHRYGFRFVRSLSGNDTPQTFVFPIASGYQPGTINGGGTNVNLNIGDPVRLIENGTIQLTQTAQDVTAANDDSDDYCFGIVAGFPRVVVGGYPRPGSFYTGGTTYTGGIGGDNAPLVTVIPVNGNIFEIDASAALGTPTKAGAMTLVGGVAPMLYSVLTSGSGQPKANPLLDAANVTKDSSVQHQLMVVGVGKIGDAQDYTAANVTFQVRWNTEQLSIPKGEATWGANLE